ncbi:DUF2617 family protein [Plantactinospora endophytica]|uniref:DUF2617 family protein n=1 Tax=Plantactinospora endophytica TaxID=673535 RepID=A0ABQ4DY26_9ACTN|nr:DUF2617 family protein [Plantactinospora endophytica]GIG87343.1 hypothetical protein Pen02_22790 [Plantactinospora endophytica]
MLVTLDTPYEDTTAAELSLALDTPEQPALHLLDLGRLDDLGQPGTRLQLRLLGASHQVVLDRPAGGLIETVACLPGRRPELPATLADPGTGYRFTARVLRLTGAQMSARTARLRRELADDPYALVGVFPGGPDAITALRLVHGAGGSGAGGGGDGEIGWHTWHAYPQSGELVETETVVTAV